ncbi:NAD(P)H-dependent oxidoreductase [Labilibacter sediminis]|nr:NAD(P)H-dependent oxidoreductase [Labilibacter sediminis]
MDIIKSLEWRYATKQFNEDKKLSSEDLQTILNAVNLAPSSYGLQPFNVLVIEDPAIREQLKQAAYGQRQVTEASQVIVFAANNNISNVHVDEFLNRISKVTGAPLEALAKYEKMMKAKIDSRNSDELLTWAAKQCYIALGFLLTTCSQLKIDACPMEGFDTDSFDEILNLKEKNLNSIVMATVGYRSDDDKYQHNPKVRKDINDLIIQY